MGPNPDDRGAAPPTVVIVDDDPLFRESLERNLCDAGFAVAAFDDGPAALAFLQSGGTAALALLDWKMPGMNGIEVLRRMRDGGGTVPVIFLTVLSDQIYEEAALIGGAVDFVEKSRSFSILLRRIQLILGGTRGGGAAADEPAEPTGQVMRVGPLELRLDSNRAAWKDREVGLTLTEFHMVRVLVERAGQDVRYRDLYDLVHGEGFVAGVGDDGYRANVRTFVKRIRQKFRDVDDEFEAIENYPGFGYRWRRDGDDAG